MEKKKVYVVSCDQTDVSKVHAASIKQVTQFIEGDIENNPEETKFVYEIKAKMMTDKQFNNLPEYNP